MIFIEVPQGTTHAFATPMHKYSEHTPLSYYGIDIGHCNRHYMPSSLGL
jgi:hypothetical protein